VLVVNPKLPVTNVAQFVQYLKANPGKAAYGSGGAGNGSHLAMVQFLQAHGVEAVHVPYKAPTGCG
ncbi:MAG: tripartite tricarboxylate transporter substrate binding protein, partial [Burkholderiaceae bacterium]|nr:tripartite tricarboxylate transporter substrate binding protein [Burkholderiaceae bacterium]